MTSSDELRRLVAEVVREAVGVNHPVTGTPLAAGELLRDETVQLRDDRDLDQFVRRLLALFENPKNRRDLRQGRVRFRLDRGSAVSAGSLPVLRIESGAVTERQVKEAADLGRRIVLGRRAVLTPLGRERAKVLSVSIEKER